MADESRRFYGLQFHPEVTHSLQGGGDPASLRSRYLPAVPPVGRLGNIIDESVGADPRAGRQRPRAARACRAASILRWWRRCLHQAIGDQLTCVFVDHGLLRLDEGDQVMATFAEHMGVHVIRVDAEQRFLEALAGDTDPEKKRKIIGRVFVEVFDEEAAKLKDVKWLAQGTIYPDVIESAGAKTGKAHVIKSHHNVGGLPRAHEAQAAGAAARTVQGRGPQASVSNWDCPRRWCIAIRSPVPALGVRILGEIHK